MQAALEIRPTLKPFRGARSNPNHLFNIAQSQYFRPSVASYFVVPVRSKDLAFVKWCSLAEKYSFRSLSWKMFRVQSTWRRLAVKLRILVAGLSRHGLLLISFIWCKSVNLIIMTPPTFTTMMSTGLKMHTSWWKILVQYFPSRGSHSGLVKHYN